MVKSQSPIPNPPFESLVLIFSRSASVSVFNGEMNFEDEKWGGFFPSFRSFSLSLMLIRLLLLLLLLLLLVKYKAFEFLNRGARTPFSFTTINTWHLGRERREQGRKGRSLWLLGSRSRGTWNWNWKLDPNPDPTLKQLSRERPKT